MSSPASSRSPMCPATESSGEPEFFRLGFQPDIFAKHRDSLHAKLCCICNKVLRVRGPGSPSHQYFRPPRDIHATPSRRKQVFGNQPRMNTESQIPRRARGWSAIRRRIANWPKPALIALVKDLHDASPENRDFLPARSERGASSMPMTSYSRSRSMSLSCWKWPETMREPLAKVSVARQEENSYMEVWRERGGRGQMLPAHRRHPGQPERQVQPARRDGGLRRGQEDQVEPMGSTGCRQ